MDDLRDLLNEKQYEAVCSDSKYLRIIAGAGSGKTRVLTYRIYYLIEKCGYYPSTIVAITFTNKAAQEIRNRVESKINMGHLNMQISTFHAYCARILREECKHLNYPSSFSIIDEDDQKKIVKNIIKENDIDPKELKISTCLDYIAYKKNTWVSPENALNESENNKMEHLKATVYEAYEKFLNNNYALDFDDLILKTILVFRNSEVTLQKWQNRIRHILVDEFQDVDPNQYELLKLLAGDNNEVSVVGDPDQTIYTWRGADVQIILNFDKDFKGTKTIALEQNYRSTGNILNVANRLIEHNHNRIKKNLFTKAENGFEIASFFGSDERAEAEYVVNNILDLYDGYENKFKDCAILYRANHQSSSIESALMNKGIKYKIYGGIKFYKRAEIKDCIAYLRLATNENDNLACDRLMENTLSGIGKATFEKIEAISATENISVFKHLKTVNLEDYYKKAQANTLAIFVKKIALLSDNFMVQPENAPDIFDEFLHNNGYLDELIHSEQDERVDNVKEFLNQMRQYFKEDGATLEEFVQNVSLMSAQDEIEEDGDFVKLMTIHTAKGLEFKNVFVYGLVEGIFPSYRSIQENKDGTEEERRLFYVAITRAEKRLFLSTSGGNSYMGPRIPSRFLREIEITAQKERVHIRVDDYRTISSDKTIPEGMRSGSLIKHDAFGEGIVLSVHDGYIDVVFKDPKQGRKTLVANHRFVHLIK